jgi:hypothetical protein
VLLATEGYSTARPGTVVSKSVKLVTVLSFLRRGSHGAVYSHVDLIDYSSNTDIRTPQPWYRTYSARFLTTASWPLTARMGDSRSVGVLAVAAMFEFQRVTAVVSDASDATAPIATIPFIAAFIPPTAAQRISKLLTTSLPLASLVCCRSMLLQDEITPHLSVCFDLYFLQGLSHLKRIRKDASGLAILVCAPEALPGLQPDIRAALDEASTEILSVSVGA